ncbi:MAG: hypothetical protein K8S99_02200 [Planctomycetes bacterium]|nr:hypothetical protein [Planctomycetota bacterium]
MTRKAGLTTWLAAALVAGLTGVSWSQQGAMHAPSLVVAQTGPGAPSGSAGSGGAGVVEPGNLDAAVRRLIAEAEELTRLDKPVEHPAVFSRPHPILKPFGADSAVAALMAMQGRLTDKPVLDTYVRWHLLEVYKKAYPAARRDKGAILLDIFNHVTDPEPLNIAAKVEYIYTPEELWRRYHPPSRPGPSGPGAPAVVVGYPPFQRVITGGAALAQMPPEQVAAYHRAVENAAKQWERNKDAANAAYAKAAAEAAAIFARLTRVDYPENVAFNRRLREANQRLAALGTITRSFRLELIYEILKTGDPRMLNMVGDAIAKQLEKGDHFGFELMAFVYLAGFDGVLELYSPQDLRNFANGMETIARRFEGYRSYSGITRNFADYSFTLIVALRQGDHLVMDQAYFNTMLDDVSTPSGK